MRIIAGQWRGRALALPPQDVTRPTTDRVREALFSMLCSRIGDFVGKHILDAFAGSGAFGLEALSRGAAHVTFAENNKKTRIVLRQNIAQFKCDDRILIHHDAFDLPTTQTLSDVIFLDPPYNKGFENQMIPMLMDRGYVGTETWVVVESDAASVPVCLPMLHCEHARIYGNCAISAWKLDIPNTDDF